MAGIKVSQDVIDAIKKRGMASSLKAAKAGASAEFTEGTNRMYPNAGGQKMRNTVKAAAPGIAKRGAAPAPVRKAQPVRKAMPARARTVAPIRGGGTANKKPAPVNVSGDRSKVHARGEEREFARSGGGAVAMPPHAQASAARSLGLPGSGSEHPFQQAKAARGPKKPTAYEAAVNSGKSPAKVNIPAPKPKKAKKPSSLSQSYGRQKSGSKYKGAYSGLGG